MAQKMSALVHEGKTFSVLKRQLMVNCDIVEDDPTLLMRPYQVKSQVSAANCELFVKAIKGPDPDLTHENSLGADVFRAFVNAIDAVSPTLTNENITDIGLVCDEFDYE
jgi:hypothetical protein